MDTISCLTSRSAITLGLLLVMAIGFPFEFKGYYSHVAITSLLYACAHTHTHTHTHTHRHRTANASGCTEYSRVVQNLSTPKRWNRHEEAHAPFTHPVPSQFSPLPHGTPPRTPQSRCLSPEDKSQTLSRPTHSSRVASYSIWVSPARATV